MKQNKGFTLVELIIVLACLTGVLGFFWKILDSSSKDAYTINDKIEVQNSVTSLMNIIQQDVQEAPIVVVAENTYGIFSAIVDSDKIYENKTYEFGDTGNKKTYEFDSGNKTVTRTSEKRVGDTVNKETAVYDNIIGFSMKAVNKSNYGAEVSIMGSKKTYSGNATSNNTGIKGIGEVKVGDYIAYTSGKAYDGKWVVLRNVKENGESKKVDIISKDSVGTLTLSGKNDYINFVKILNDECGKYINKTYAISGRSVGGTEDSIDRIDENAKPLTYAATSGGYGGTSVYNPSIYLPYADAYWQPDVGIIRAIPALQHSKVNTYNDNGQVWLASRAVSIDKGNSLTNFCGRYTAGTNFANINYFALYYARSNLNDAAVTQTHGLRPVITLKPGIRITGGNGDENSPYTIAIGDAGNYTESNTGVDKSRYSLDSTFYTRNTTR